MDTCIHCSCYYNDKVEDPDGLWQKCCECGKRQHEGLHPMYVMLQELKVSRNAI